jgi:hypothetical protein
MQHIDMETRLGMNSAQSRANHRLHVSLKFDEKLRVAAPTALLKRKIANYGFPLVAVTTQALVLVMLCWAKTNLRFAINVT